MTPPTKLDDCFVKTMRNCPFFYNTNLQLILTITAGS